MNLTEQEKNQLAKQYLPLIKKISYQKWHKVNEKVPLKEIESYANLGFALALEKYDENKSTQTFKQYAAWSISFSIMNGLTECSQAVRVSYYYQCKLKSEGQSSIVTSTVSSMSRDDTSDGIDDDASITACRSSAMTLREAVEEDFEDCLDMNPIDILVESIKSNFDEIHSKIFLASFGLDGWDEGIKGKDLADMLGISPTLVTFKKNDVIRWIRSREDLMEILSRLMKK